MIHVSVGIAQPVHFLVVFSRPTHFSTSSVVNFGILGSVVEQTVNEGTSFTVTVGIIGSPALDDDFVLGFAVQIYDQSGNDICWKV